LQPKDPDRIWILISAHRSLGFGSASKAPGSGTHWSQFFIYDDTGSRKIILS
jgi:hypothetical protein